MSKNEKLRISLGNNTAGCTYQLVLSEELKGKLTVSPELVNADSTDITLEAKPDAAGLERPLTGKIEVWQRVARKDPVRMIGRALTVQMFPSITVKLGIYFWDDKASALDDLPQQKPVTPEEIRAGLNKAYGPYGITFTFNNHPQYPIGSTLDASYDRDPKDGKLSFIGNKSEAEDIYKYEEREKDGAKAFPSPLNIILVNSLLNDPAATGLAQFWTSPLSGANKKLHKFLFLACGSEVVGGETIVKTAVHEVGHAFRLATREGFDPKTGRVGTGKRDSFHDIGIFPSEALNDIMGANYGMVGIMNPIVEANWEYWLRHEDWYQAWTTAKAFFP